VRPGSGVGLAALLVVVVAAVAAWLILQERQRNARLTEELSAAQIQLEDQAEQMEAARETFARYRAELRDARTQMVGQHDEIKGTRRTAQPGWKQCGSWSGSSSTATGA